MIFTADDEEPCCEICGPDYGWRRYCRISNIDEVSENNDNELMDELHNMSIEEIMTDGGFSREVATAIYEAKHGIYMEEVTLEQLLCEIHNI